MSKALQLKITLWGSKPPIWRRILVKDSIPFHELHEIIQDVMGWYNSHLYEFGSRNSLSIGLPYEEAFEDMIDSRKTKVGKYLNQVGDQMEYCYDFGDNWIHELEVERVEDLDKTIKYPVCLKGKGNCPPEDCGGIPGYYHLLEVIKNKKHPDHEDMLDWLGEDFDPDEFDLEGVNEMLKEYY